MIEFTTYSNDSSLVDVNLSISEFTPGVYLITGYINIFYDVNDDTIFNFSMSRSQTIDGEYSRLPFDFNEGVTGFANKLYKPALMELLQRCATDAPYFTDQFVAPLRPTNITLNDCYMPEENPPSSMPFGFYLIYLNATGPVKVSVKALWSVYNTM